MTNGKTGYWKNLGFFSTYYKGHLIGRYPTPEQAEAAIREEEKKESTTK